MATATVILEVNAKANADLSTKQFFCVKQTALDTVDLCSAATDRTFGILTNAPKSAQAAEIQTDGIAKVVSDGSGTAIAVGDKLAVDANSRVVKNTTVDRWIVGEAMDASAALGTVIRVKLALGTMFRTAA